MNKEQILRLLAAVIVLAGVIILWVLPDFGVDFLRSFTAIIITLVLLIVSALYLEFVPDAEEGDAHKKKRQRFEKAGLVVIIACSPVQFFCPRAGFLVLLLSLSVLYWLLFLRRAKQGKE
jgi:hypothetical protein